MNVHEWCHLQMKVQRAIFLCHENKHAPKRSCAFSAELEMKQIDKSQVTGVDTGMWVTISYITGGNENGTATLVGQFDRFYRSKI